MCRAGCNTAQPQSACRTAGQSSCDRAVKAIPTGGALAPSFRSTTIPSHRAGHDSRQCCRMLRCDAYCVVVHIVLFMPAELSQHGLHRPLWFGLPAFWCKSNAVWLCVLVLCRTTWWCLTVMHRSVHHCTTTSGDSGEWHLLHASAKAP